MASEHREPAGHITETQLRRMSEHGGVARLAAGLLAHGLDDNGHWDLGRLDRHLDRLDDRDSLRECTVVLKTAAEDPEFDPATMELIDGLLDAYNRRDPDPLLASIGEWL